MDNTPEFGIVNRMLNCDNLYPEIIIHHGQSENKPWLKKNQSAMIFTRSYRQFWKYLSCQLKRIQEKH